MRHARAAVWIIMLAATIGYAAPTDSLPPNTVLLSEVMRELSARPGFTEAFLQQLQGGSPKGGTALLTPDLLRRLRELIVGKDWSGLDRFPGWTMSEITPTVGAIARMATSTTDAPGPDKQSDLYLDLGPYAMDQGGQVADLRDLSTLPGYDVDVPITDLDNGLTRPDGPGPLANTHADSQRLAYVLNRLATNGVDGVASANVKWNDEVSATTPEALIDDIMRSGHTVTVTDTRYFANFGQLHYKGKDVMMPFFLNAQIIVPGTKRPLLVAASHAQYEWHIRGQQLNADVSFYFAIDGKAQFRAMDQLNQSWVLGRNAHEYRQADAVEVTRLASAIARTYLHLHRAHPSAPFHGYYAFGVCQDVVAAIELKMTGKDTVFPNTSDDMLFTDPRDAEINKLMHRLPRDRGTEPPSVERVFGSLPVGSSDAELARVTIPGLGADLIAVRHAWVAGELKRSKLAMLTKIEIALVGMVGLLLVLVVLRRRSKR
jgi:hypothetical protein